MQAFLLAALLLLAPVLAHSLECRLAWQPPTTNADGTALEDLAGYRLYSSPVSGQYTLGLPTVTLADPHALGAVVPCSEGEFWSVTAYDTATPPNESVFSNEVQIADQRPPSAPGSLRIVEIILKLGQ